jgi:predicted Zn finger-like uncharacterized protein
MLTTRCPACSTVFRIRAEQLNQRGGRVRCGTCHTAFLALSTLEELPDDTPLPDGPKPANPKPTGPTPLASMPSPSTMPAASPLTPPLETARVTPAEPPRSEAAAPVQRSAAPARRQPDAEAQDFAARTLVNQPIASLTDPHAELGVATEVVAPDFEVSLDEAGPRGIERREPTLKKPMSGDEQIEITGLHPELDEPDPFVQHEDAARKHRHAHPAINLQGDAQELAQVLQQMSNEDNAPRREDIEGPATVFLDDPVLAPVRPRGRGAAWWSGMAALAALALACPTHQSVCGRGL